MAYALAFLGLLAFVGWVLWLRERRIETVKDQLLNYRRQFDAAMLEFSAAKTATNMNTEAFLAATREVKGFKDEMTAVRMRLGLSTRRIQDPVLAMPQDQTPR